MIENDIRFGQLREWTTEPALAALKAEGSVRSAVRPVFKSAFTKRFFVDQQTVTVGGMDGYLIRFENGESEKIPVHIIQSHSRPVSRTPFGPFDI